MRISRKKRPQKALIPHFNINEQIRVPEVRLIDLEGANIGVISTREALQKARDQELDLVEINPKAEPPICKIIDFTHFKYHKEKEVRKQKANSHVSELKGIRLSIRISDHDLGIRKDQAEKFLNRGDKVKAEVVMRGRDRAQAHLGYDVVRKFAGMIGQTVNIRIEQEPTQQGNTVSAIFAKQ